MITKLEEIVDLAKNSGTKKLAIAVAEDKYVLNAIDKAKKLGLIVPIFIGNKQKIKEAVAYANLSIDEIDIIDKNSVETACIEAVKLVSEGKADFLMKGGVSTSTLLKYVVSRDYGLVNNKLLSHLAIFESPSYPKLLGVTDAAMNIAPNLDDKAKILTNSISAFHALGIESPKVAVLAAVEKVNTKMQATVDAAALTIMAARHQFGKCQVDGPLALDNAISPEAAAHKKIESQVAGKADILLAPDIESGNILYKSLAFLGNAKCAAIILGGKSPIVLTSRADSEENKFLSIALGVLTTK